MILYSFKHHRADEMPWVDAPNPRRIRVVLSEKGLKIKTVPVNLVKREHLTSEFLKINPLATLPCLKLDSGLVISDSIAMAEYFEELNPLPSLIGTTAERRAQVRALERRFDANLIQRSMHMFRHSSKHCEGRWPQSKAVYDDMKSFVRSEMAWVEQNLDLSRFVLGEFSLADISLMIGYDYAFALGLEPDPQWKNFSAWHARMKQRPSYRA